MKIRLLSLVLALILMVSASSFVFAAVLPTEDPGWPRLIEAKGKELTIYQPQVDSWNKYTTLHFRCAIAVKTSKSAEEKFGVAEVEADTVVDQDNRVVALVPKSRTLRFPNTSDSKEKKLADAVEELYPQGKALTLSLDRVIAYLDPEKQAQQHAVELNLDPPKIFFSSKPAILLIFLGAPQLQPVVKDQNDLMFAVNTNWPVFYDTAVQQYYLLNGENWLMTADAKKGPWAPAAALPKNLSSLPDDENWADVKKQIPGKRVSTPPAVFTSTEPAELILTQGEPTFSPIGGTKLMRVANTESLLFLHSDKKSYYLLSAGRWFRAADLDGPWSAASTDLPADFTKIPDDDPSAFVKASVPGTTEAKDAVLLASIPTKTVATISDPPVIEVSYEGKPDFQTIEKTTIKYAVNSSNSVFLVDGKYYCCNNGIWFVSSAASGPWVLCTSVPEVIYTIPPSHPLYNVTYVVVQSTTPTTVIYTETAGYYGEYVAATGVLMFGAGVMAGAMIVNSHRYYHHHYPVPYSYGWGARYSYHHGGYYGASRGAYGPYAGRGAAVAYNPRTGTYSRGAHAYGPAGSASVRQSYNPYSGARSSSARVDTAYGSAGRASAYNPSTGTAARGGYRTGAQGSAVALQTNRGTGAAAVRTNSGAGATAWDTKHGQGAVARDRQGNVYAGKDGNVYKKENSGNWNSNSGKGWQSTSKSAPTRDLNSQVGTRNRSNQMHRSSRGGGGGGGRRR